MKRAVIRLPSEIVERLDKLAEELSAANPKRKFSRAAVVRVLLTRGLGAVDAVHAAGGSLDGALEAVISPGPVKTERGAP